MQFNAKKCKVMHIGPSDHTYTYKMKTGETEVELESLEVEKDLGVYIDNKLKFSTHVENAAAKTNKLVGMIRRSYTHLTRTNFRYLFKSIVRPHLEYGNAVWSPRLTKDINTIENVQRRAPRLIPGMRDKSYEERLSELQLPSLVFRRLRGDMIEVYKHLNNKYKNCSVLSRVGENITRGHNLKLQKQRCHTPLRANFFSLRVTDYWNSLPEHIVNATSTNSFKNQINKHWKKCMYPIDIMICPHELKNTGSHKKTLILRRRAVKIS